MYGLRKAFAESTACVAPYLVVEFDDGTSVIKSKMILDPPLASLRVDHFCQVKWGKQMYSGKVLAIGKKHEMDLFIENLFNSTTPLTENLKSTEQQMTETSETTSNQYEQSPEPQLSTKTKKRGRPKGNKPSAKKPRIETASKKRMEVKFNYTCHRMLAW